jgi:hypothetical protein
MLADLSHQESQTTLAHARDPTKHGKLVFDNVQNYLRQRDARIGRENTLNIGIAATYIELEDIDPKAFNLDDKRQRLKENKRRNLTVDQLLGFIDNKHIDTVGTLQWLRVLTNYIPQLHKWKREVSMLYRTRGAKLRLPERATKIHPLASSGKKETVMTELKDALADFFGQMGQTPGNYLPRLFPMGGDGLTFAQMLQLKRYMQFHNDPFEALETLNPGLESWHTEWTGLSCDYETHWGALLSDDPAALGHSAHKIDRAEPANLSKVDYYAGAEVAFLTLDVRMLDCWR